ncbi:hypothetical protein [Aquimarina aggregata]|uniref:hypothetical protein n=1 Tax=Aquimarina aggregata TaxID=1642818 RepID=UPI00248F95E2|nr:hypothetical protein [Aquimarina aggregata]
MVYRLFYSYQSDIKKALNESFIEDALDKAVKGINGCQIKIIKGFRETSGQLPLADTMLKQSESSDIFVGDITITSEFNDHRYKNHWLFSSYQKIGKEGRVKKYPNCNVSIETGYSWAKKGYDRTILIMNTAYGNPKELPVDMGHLRWPITYTLSEQDSLNQEIKGKVFEDLVKDLRTAIKAAIKTTQEYQRKRFFPFKQHQIWKRRDFKNPIVITDRFKDVITKLRQNLSKPGASQRLVGPKKSGKSRLAWQLFKRVDHTLKRDDSIEKILYYDLDDSSYSAIENRVLDLRELNQDHIVIVDNCPLNIHNKLCNDLLDTNVRILTIWSRDQEEIESGDISLDKAYTQEITEKMISNRYSGGIVSNLISEVDGDLNLATAYATSDLTDESDIKTDYASRWEQLLGKELFDKGALEVLEEISLFSHIGFASNHKYQLDFIISNTNVGLSVLTLDGLILRLSERGFIETKGDFVSCQLSSEELIISRLQKLKEQDITSFIKLLSKYNLSKQFANHLVKNRSDQIDQIIEKLTEEDGLVGKYEFINSKEGSILINKLSEIYPTQISRALSNTLIGKPIEEFSNIEAGRRNLIWALEKLCYNKDTAHNAIKLLFKLALAENEEIANNATNQFIVIFQPRLAPTIVSLNKRIEVLKELEKNYGMSNLILSAYAKMLQATNYIGTITTWGDKQEKFEMYGSKKGIPVKELLSYFEFAIDRLSNLAFDNGSEFRQTATEVLINKFPEQYVDGNNQKILDVIIQLIDHTGGLSNKLRGIIDNLIFRKFGLDQDRLEKLEQILDNHQPRNIGEELNIKVINAPYKSEKVDNGWRDVAKEEAQNFAKQLLETNSKEWLSFIPNLLSGDQRQTYAFGEIIGVGYEDFDKLIDIITESLNEIPVEQQNITFIAGIVTSRADTDFTRKVIDQLLDKHNTMLQAVRVTRLLKTDIELTDFEKLYDVIGGNPQIIRALERIDISNLDDGGIEILSNLMAGLPPYGYPIALEILWDLIDKYENRWEGLADVIIPLVMREGILNITTLYGSSYPIEDLVKKTVAHKNDEETIHFFINEILNGYEELFVPNETLLNRMILFFLEEYYSMSWSLIGEKLLNEQYIGSYNLKSVLRYFKHDNEEIRNWIENNLPDAPAVIIDLIPIEDKNDEGKLVWDSFALELLNNYAGNEYFISNLSTRFHNYSVAGSAVPLYEERKKLLEQLLDNETPEIVEFAKKEIEVIKLRIIREKNFDENYNLGEL